MLHTSIPKRFYRKTKRGSVVMIIREHYLRDDIPCGLDKCQHCVNCDGVKPTKRARDDLKSYNGFIPTNVTISSDRPRSELCKSIGSHIIIPDGSIFMKQFNILDDPNFGSDIICLQTAMSQVRASSLAAYSRNKQLQTNSSARRFSTFCNDFHSETYRERQPGENIDDYSDRLTRVATKWFAEHWASQPFDVILLTCKSAVKERGSEMGIKCLLIQEYLEDFRLSTELLDKVAPTNDNESKSEKDQVGKDFLYPEHLPLPSIHRGIKAGNLYQGKFNCNRDNRREGQVTISLKASNEDDYSEVHVLIQGDGCINRAVHEDIVAIEILPETEWKSSMDLVEEDDQDQDGLSKSIETQEASLANTKKRPTGRVVGIIRRAWRPYCGIIKSQDLSQSLLLTHFSFIPFDKRIPVIRIETRQHERLKNHKIVVQIDNWPRDSRYPRGHYVKSLGVAGDKETENEVLLLEHDVPHDDFSPAILGSLPPDDYSIPQEELKNRTDLRHLVICSVDPPGCTDIDDALHARILPPTEQPSSKSGDIIEVGVHIADVSYYVKPGSPIDEEASRRGTTVYLVDRRIDMIPSRLSSDLCSLREGVDRLTFSCIWKIERSTGRIIDTTFSKSIIKSAGALTYAEAQLKIDSPTDRGPIATSLRLLNELAKKLKQARLAAGALVLASAAEIKFIETDSELAENTLQIEQKQMRETNSMVEEFMLLANIAVALKIYEELPELALLRRHPKPAPENFADLIDAAQKVGFNIDVNTGKGLSDSLAVAHSKKDALLNLMLRMICTRCMTQARYFCAGALSTGVVERNESSEDTSAKEVLGGGNFAHFGLATQIYTHFTSPIRRYADLLVHRLLAHSIGHTPLTSSMVNKRQLASITDNLNYRHRMEQYAQRSSVALNTVRFIKKSPGGAILNEPARIMKIAKNALKVFIPRLALEVNYFTNAADGWNYDEKLGAQCKGAIAIKQFDSVMARLGVTGQDTNREIISVKITTPPLDTI